MSLAKSNAMLYRSIMHLNLSQRKLMNRRNFIASLAGAAFAHAQQRFDILIRNGTVCDPASGTKRRADVGIAGGKVAAIENSIPANRGAEVIDANGLYVTPGLV